MLRLLEGGFFSGKDELIQKRISELCALSKKSILIVPEQETVAREAEMADFLPPSAPLFFEATNFSRFADTVFRSLGGLAGKASDQSKRALILWRAFNELLPMLDTYRSYREISVGNVTKMMGVIKQMQSYSITPELLANAADEIESKGKKNTDGRTIPKLRDLSMLMTVYKKLIKEHFVDSEDSLLAAEEKLSATPSDFLKDTEIFIDGFTSFTEPQYKMIGALIKRCNVTIGLNLPKADSEAFEYSEIRNTHLKLINIASAISADVKLEKIDGRGGTPPIISEVASLLWKSTAKIDTDTLSNTDSFKIYEAETPFDECDFVAQDIRRRVMAGAKYSDFGIIARSIDTFDGILDVSFKKAGIPLFMSKSSDITSYDAVKLIFCALDVISGGFARRDVISYSKCSLSGVTRSQSDELELYSEKWQISGARFTDGIFWNMNPYGYSDRRPADSEEKLIFIDGARRAAVDPLIAFGDDINGAKTVKERATALVSFLTSLGVESELRKRSAAEKAEANPEAKDTERIYKLICDTLDSLCEILGDSEVSLDTFVNLLKISFSGANVGKIPSFKEEVTAGSADVSRMRGKKYIYVIGVNSGSFPPPIDDSSYFSSADRRVLSELGLEVDMDTGIKSARELFYLSRAISYASREAILTYSSKNTEFKAYAPSEAIGRIRDLSYGKILPAKISKMSIKDMVYSAEYALEKLSTGGSYSKAIEAALADTDLKEAVTISGLDIKNSEITLSDSSLELLYGKKIPLTQSKLELYSKCPMCYFCTYDLKLKPTERAEFDSRNIGNFLHSVLENFFGELKLRGKKIAEISEEEKISLINKVADEYTRGCFEGITKTPARLADTVKKLSRAAKPIIDGLCEEFSSCKYEPVFFELEIGSKNPDSPEPVIFNTDDGKEVFITGKIDRVDTYKSGEDVYVRVIDYKSGKKIFSPSDLKEGKNLQMFLYLKSVVESENPDFLRRAGLEAGERMIPAGVIYVKTSIDDAKISKNDKNAALGAVRSNQERLGMLLNDDESIGAMNPEFLPIKLKDGKPDSRSESKVYSESGWEEINKTVKQAVTKIASEMTGGNIHASPKRKPNGKSEACEWCEFKSLCRNSN